MSKIIRRDPLAAILEYRSKSVPIAEYNLLLERIEQLENKLAAISHVNTQLSEIVNEKKGLPDREKKYTLSYID